MKSIIVALLAISLAGCGPHFLGKPEPVVDPVPQAPPKTETITITVPNWPVSGYSVDGAILILLVKDPKTFPVPGAFTFKRDDGTVITMPMVKPDKKP